MKKIRNLSESDFLKLLFLYFSAAFLVAALCMPDRADMFSGLIRILTTPGKVSTNTFAVGGYAGAFLNVGLVSLVCTLLYCIPGAKASNVSTLAFLLTAGFCFWGITLLNIWPTFAGVALYCLVKREKLSANVNAMLFSTGIAPLITDLMIRYPNADVVGFNLRGVLIAIFVGLIIGFFLPAGLVHSPKVHKGFDLYSAAVPVCFTAFFLRAVLYQVLGGTLPAAPDAAALAVCSWPISNVFCFVTFGLCILVAFLMGCSPRDYLRLLKDDGYSVSFSSKYGTAAMLMNTGVYGLFIVLYYNLVGASFNAVTLGCIFCMVCCCNSGSHPGNVWPIMAGYMAASLVFARLYVGDATFGQAINAQAIVIGLCFANGLSPISGKYGWPFGLMAGVLHFLIVTSVPLLHGGFCLYNGGCTAAIVCLLYIPVLERFIKTKEERKLAR